MLDYFTLEASTEFPAFFTIFYTVLLAFILSSIVAFTHYKTSRNIIPSIEFLQSLILVSIVCATVMQAIGDSLARGLGMLGALAIIRYRTTLKTPRNMVFTFAALAAGIACGVYAYVIAITGTVGFCIVAFALRISPLSKPTALLGVLTFLMPIDQNTEFIEEIMVFYSQGFRKVKFQLGNPKKQAEEVGEPFSELYSFEYELAFNSLEDSKALFQNLKESTSLSQVKLTFQHENENV